MSIADDYGAIGRGLRQLKQERGEVQCTSCNDAGWIAIGNSGHKLCSACGNPERKSPASLNKQEPHWSICGNCEGSGWVLSSSPNPPSFEECRVCCNPKGLPSP